MFKFRSNSGQKCSPEQKCSSGTGTGTGIPVDLWLYQTIFNFVIQEISRNDFTSNLYFIL